jgi:hypothetical protein
MQTNVGRALALAHYYRQARRYQLETYGLSGLYFNGRSARQFTGGGAYYGCHAEAAINQARGQLRLREDLARLNKRKRK